LAAAGNGYAKQNVNLVGRTWKVGKKEKRYDQTHRAALTIDQRCPFVEGRNATVSETVRRVVMNVKIKIGCAEAGA